MTRLQTILLAVEHVERAATFYRAAFGWETSIDLPVIVDFQVPGGGSLSVYKREGFNRNTESESVSAAGDQTSGTELYFHCDDLEAAIERIEAAGARSLSPLSERGWGDEAAYFADPDGNVIALARPIEEQTTPV